MYKDRERDIKRQRNEPLCTCCMKHHRNKENGNMKENTWWMMQIILQKICCWTCSNNTNDFSFIPIYDQDKRWQFMMFPSVCCSDLSIWSADCDPQRALQAAARSRPHSAGGVCPRRDDGVRECVCVCVCVCVCWCVWSVCMFSAGFMTNLGPARRRTQKKPSSLFIRVENQPWLPKILLFWSFYQLCWLVKWLVCVCWYLLELRRSPGLWGAAGDGGQTQTTWWKEFINRKQGRKMELSFNTKFNITSSKVSSGCQRSKFNDVDWLHLLEWIH